MRLGGRQDLTARQRETVQTIWANWSVRRAGAAIDNNDNQRAVEILEAASLSFPDNLTVRKVLAGGYLRTGQTKEALSIYKSIGMQDASAADFQGAIGAALAANDKAQAEDLAAPGAGAFPAPIPPSWPSRPALNRLAATISALPTTGELRWPPCRKCLHRTSWHMSSCIRIRQ